MIYNTIALSLVLAAVTSATLYTSDESQQKYMWESFKRDYGRSYETMEEEFTRFNNFVMNLRIADKRNQEDTAVHGITKFFDLSQQEFRDRYLRADPSKKVGGAPVLEVSEPPRADLGLVDWEGKLTTPVKDQGYCGSCWAFSATEQIETEAIRTLGASYLLSPQQIVSCAGFPDMGCNGGWTEGAYTYVKNAGGLETEADYPYTSYQGRTGTCASTASKFKVKVTGYSTLKSEADMASFTQTTGPLSVCVDANNWNSYKSGIMTTCGTSVDHCVQAVGVDAASTGYWKVRNSWGTSWGENGHIRLAYGKNTCAITNDPTVPTVALA
jgi:hypothetical protein